jgi:hypothetical protein
MPNGQEYNRDGPNGLGITQGKKRMRLTFMLFERIAEWS